MQESQTIIPKTLNRKLAQSSVFASQIESLLSIEYTGHIWPVWHLNVLVLMTDDVFIATKLKLSTHEIKKHLQKKSHSIRKIKVKLHSPLDHRSIKTNHQIMQNTNAPNTTNNNLPNLNVGLSDPELAQSFQAWFTSQYRRRS